MSDGTNGRPMRFRVKGTMIGTYYCECPHCDGHTTEEAIDDMVLAHSVDEAQRVVVERVEASKRYDDYDWLWDYDFSPDYEPQIEMEPLPEDQWMRLIGAPRLFEAALKATEQNDNDRKL